MRTSEHVKPIRVLPHWYLTKDGDPRALALYERHYPCRHYQDGRLWRFFCGPSEKIVLISRRADALFVWAAGSELCRLAQRRRSEEQLPDPGSNGDRLAPLAQERLYTYVNRNKSEAPIRVTASCGRDGVDAAEPRKPDLRYSRQGVTYLQQDMAEIVLWSPLGNLAGPDLVASRCCLQSTWPHPRQPAIPTILESQTLSERALPCPLFYLSGSSHKFSRLPTCLSRNRARRPTDTPASFEIETSLQLEGHSQSIVARFGLCSVADG